MLLALYETKGRLERGGTSASSFSIDLGAADPGLPAFLTPFAGPIHSVPVNDDLDLFYADSTLQHNPESNIDASWEREEESEACDLTGEAGDSECA